MMRPTINKLLNRARRKKQSNNKLLLSKLPQCRRSIIEKNCAKMNEPGVSTRQFYLKISHASFTNLKPAKEPLNKALIISIYSLLAL